MTTAPYPQIFSETPKDLAEVLRAIVRERPQDVADFNNLTKIFMRGRKVGKIPADAADVDDADRLGDFNYDADYLYLCVDDSGAAWRRVALGSW